MKLVHLGWLVLPIAGIAHAQDSAEAAPSQQPSYYVSNVPELRSFTEEEISAVKMPALAFESSPAIEDDFKKYFYFHRPDTDFSTAYADITECDALSSGMSYYGGASQSAINGAMAQYGALAGAAGGVIASVLVDVIFGSGARREQRRTNMRNCMYYKEYDRYGLEKGLWTEFNFEEGLSKENEQDRAAALLMQAKVASGPKPVTEVLLP